MYCPDCKEKLKCGCKTCVELKTGEASLGKRMLCISGTQLEACPCCGVVRVNEEWASIEFKQYDELVETDKMVNSEQ